MCRGRQRCQGSCIDSRYLLVLFVHLSRISSILISEFESDANESRSSLQIFDSFGWKESVEDAKQKGIFKSKIVGYPEL